MEPRTTEVSDDLALLADELRQLSQPASLGDLSGLCAELDLRGHVAILQNPYLDLVLNGRKTAESRFGKRRSSPYGQVRRGDILILKEAGGPICGVALVRDVDYFGPLQRTGVLSLFRQFASQLQLQRGFRRIKSDAKYATIIHLQSVMRLSRLSLAKRDRRAWVSLTPRQSPLYPATEEPGTEPLGFEH